MANVLRIAGAIGILMGLALVVLALMPLAQGQPVSLLGSPLVTQAVISVASGIVALGFGQLIAVNQSVADNMADLLDYIRSQDEAGAPPAGTAHDVFANVPDYSPRRDPPIIKEGTYRDYTVLTLEDGTVAVQTASGWKRFRKIRDFDRLLTA